jgi:trimethylamine:corrinoid methyltransferase-like protein
MLGVPVGGHFLDSDHTVSACRDQLIPRVFQRMGRDDYEASGRRTALDAAREAALSAIEAAPPSHLSEDQAREIAALTRAADRHIVEVYQGAVETI